MNINLTKAEAELLIDAHDLWNASLWSDERREAYWREQCDGLVPTDDWIEYECNRLETLAANAGLSVPGFIENVFIIANR